MTTQGRNHQVLIIDDSPTIRSQIRACLEQEGLVGEVFEAADGLAGFKLLLQHPISLVLCDLVMPQFDGYKFLSLKESRPELREVPVILLTGVEKIEDKVRGLEAGATDYVTKPFIAAELLARVKSQLKMRSLQDELHAAYEQVKTLSITDELTGLANRRHLLENLSKELERARRYRGMVAFVLLDLDHFKAVNDTHGHLVGDEVLRGVGKVLMAGLRKNDLAGRYGGEELAALLLEAAPDGALIVVERLRAAIAEVSFASSGGSFNVTASFGVTLSRGDETAAEVIKRADDALYRAKEGGRNRVEMCPPPPAPGA